MQLKKKNRLYVLADSEDLANVYYIEDNTVKKQPIGAFNDTSNWPFLKDNPLEWNSEEISYATSEKYKSLNRSFNLGLTFIGEAAQIIRNQLYFGKGSEEVMYMAILKWNRSDDKYYLEYKGKLDFSTAEDDVNLGIKLNSVEGGVQSYLSTNDGLSFDILCDDSNPAIQQVFLDGMNLSETLNYSFIKFDAEGDRYIVPLVFLNNEGDHEDVLYGNPTYELIPNTDYFKTSNNYIVENIGSNDVTFHLEGDLVIDEIDSDGNTGIYRLKYDIASSTEVISYDTDITTTGVPSGKKIIHFSFNVTLSTGQKLFINHQIFYSNPGVTGGLIKYAESSLKISFISRKSSSYAYCLTLYDYYKLLVLKLTNGLYTGESSYLAARTDLVITCGDALRNTDRTIVPNYYIASSFEECFQSIPGNPAIGSSCGLQVRNNVLYLELLSDLFNDNATIYELGQVSKFKIKVAQIQANQISAGYADQQYDTNGGKFEVNSEQEWKMPIISKKDVFDIRSKWRADPRGIEQIRSKYTKLDTTDNQGDKEPFVLQVAKGTAVESYVAQTDSSVDYTNGDYVLFNGVKYGNYMTPDSNNYQFVFTGGISQIANINLSITIGDAGTHQVILFKNGQSIAVYTGNDSIIHLTVASDKLKVNDVYQVKVISFDDDSFTITQASLIWDFLIKPYTLQRLPYDSITGVLDDTIFNVELRPKNQIYAHGNEIHEILAQQELDSIVLTSNTKNVELVTVFAGIEEAEKSQILVSSLAAPRALPYDFEITTEVPYTFNDLLAMSTAGYFSFIEKGILFFGKPIGSLKATPTTNASQTWTLRASTKNTFTNFFNASKSDLINFTFSNNMIAIPIYCPLHLIKYNFTQQSKYHHKDMYEDWSYKRFADWFNVPFYTQKWQLDDTIKIPAISSGLGNLSYTVYDVNGNLYTSGLFNLITTEYVRSPYSLQEADINLASFDEGLYLFVVKAGSENIYISEWCDIRQDWHDSLLIKYSHSQNELNVPWLAYNGFLELRVEALLEQWELVVDSVGFRDDGGNSKILSDTTHLKRNMVVGTTRKVPEWMGLKVGSILFKDKVYIEGDDSTNHYTREEGSQIEMVKYNGMPYLSYNIEIIAAENQAFLLNENVPITDVHGWHATITAQVFGSDYGDEEITILNE